MLNQFMRYLLLAQLVKNEHCEIVLEVGGGVKGLNRYLPGQAIVGVDINFKDTAVIATERFKPIIGSALRLPFESGSFPVVVCSDVLEHIAGEDRETAIKELCRVAGRKVFLAFPVNETYGWWERLLLKTYRLFRAPPPDWLEDHIAKGLPKEADISGFLQRSRMPFTVVPNENNFIHFLVMLAEMTFLCGYLNYISDILAPETWDKGGHSRAENLVRSIFTPVKRLPRFLNFGSTVRKIFIIDKRSGPTGANGVDIAGYYDTHPEMMCSPFGGLGGPAAGEHPYLSETLKALNADIRGKKILDVGCGAGWVAQYCEGIASAYAGVDVSLVSVETARKVTPDIWQADGQNLPFKPASFDYVFSIDSFEHVPDQVRAAREFYRVLNKEGRVFLSVPNYSNVAGIVKKLEESLGFYKKDTWAPFDHWSYQALEQFMTPGRVRNIFKEAGFTRFSVIGGGQDLLDGVFPWINHRYMPCPGRVRRVFSYIQKPLERFYYLSLHNFWLIEK